MGIRSELFWKVNVIRESVCELDQFFSPRDVADTVANVFVDVFANALTTSIEIVDFCAGHGSLLDGMSKRLACATLVATDIDRSCVRYLKKHRPSWSVGKLDLLSGMSRLHSPLYCDNRYAGFVLNPPFSGRGAQVVHVQLSDGKEFACSRPLAFFLLSTQALRVGGVGVAVLPLSTLRSDRDARAIRWLSDYMDLTVHVVIGRGGFSGVAAQSAVVSVRRCEVRDTFMAAEELGEVSRALNGASKGSQMRVSLFRGKLPVYRRFFHLSGNEEGMWARYVHTTDLREPVSAWGSIIVDEGTCTVGECVLIPRVGRISSQSIVAYSDITPLVLSDCLFALSPLDSSLALEDLRSVIADKVGDFINLSQATGAPYLTVAQVRSVIEGAGCDVVVHHCKTKCIHR